MAKPHPLPASPIPAARPAGGAAVGTAGGWQGPQGTAPEPRCPHGAGSAQKRARAARKTGLRPLWGPPDVSTAPHFLTSPSTQGHRLPPNPEEVLPPRLRPCRCPPPPHWESCTDLPGRKRPPSRSRLPLGKPRLSASWGPPVCPGGRIRGPSCTPPGGRLQRTARLHPGTSYHQRALGQGR